MLLFGSIYIYAKVVKSQTKKLTFYGFLSDDDIFRYDDVMQILVPMTFLIVFSLFCRLRAKKVYIERLVTASVKRRHFSNLTSIELLFELVK